MVLPIARLSLLDGSPYPQRPTNTTPANHSDLWLCIYLPKLALEALEFDPTGTSACAALDEIAGKLTIHTVSTVAESAGVTPGMPLTAAYALCPQLTVRLRDLRAETQALQRLATWAGRFSPVVSLEPPQALLLEIRSSLRLFHGLSALLQGLGDELLRRGQKFFIAVAPTPLASQWLASGGHRAVISYKEGLRSALGQLPITHLPLEASQIKRLTRAGIYTLHELWRLPRDGLARRFSPQLLDILDRALGIQPEPREIFTIPYHFQATLDLPAEAHNTDLLLKAARHLLAKLTNDLRRRDAGTTQLRLTLYHGQHPASQINIGVRHSTRDESRLYDLLQARLNRLQLAAPVTTLSLFTDQLHPFIPVSQALLTQQEIMVYSFCQDQEWQHLLEHLRARLGAKAVHNLQAPVDHRPEQVGYRIAAATDSYTRSNRPLWLLPRPQRLSLRNNHPWRQGALSLIGGPERIETGWWDGRDIRRDYYIATDIDATRLWIFRDLRAGHVWYLHGLFG